MACRGSPDDADNSAVCFPHCWQRCCQQQRVPCYIFLRISQNGWELRHYTLNLPAFESSNEAQAQNSSACRPQIWSRSRKQGNTEWHLFEDLQVASEWRFLITSCTRTKNYYRFHCRHHLPLGWWALSKILMLFHLTSSGKKAHTLFYI